ncbi:hypothetical protein FACS1894169_16180 [Bacteroidia bacterium]|nr:hypothetical protein FACS1894169_16180 [Bacteroidia bacterium]
MSKEPIYVAFSTQKGGAGKTTLTVLAASCLHYEMGYNVAIIDCDFPQHSIHSMRKRDFKMLEDDEFYKGMAYEQFTRLEGKKAYPIVESDTSRAIADAERIVEDYDMDFDIIFFDLPGTMNNRDLILTLAYRFRGIFLSGLTFVSNGLTQLFNQRLFFFRQAVNTLEGQAQLVGIFLYIAFRRTSEHGPAKIKEFVGKFA